MFLERRSIILNAVIVHPYMKELGIKSVVAPLKILLCKGECYKKFVLVLERKFETEQPNQKCYMILHRIFKRRGKVL